jgi:hypothetical protein
MLGGRVIGRVAPTVGYAVQVSSHQSEEEAQSSFIANQIPKFLGGYTDHPARQSWRQKYLISHHDRSVRLSGSGNGVVLETQSRRRRMRGVEELISIGHGPTQPQDALNKLLARGQGGPQLSALTTRKIGKRIVGHG